MNLETKDWAAANGRSVPNAAPVRGEVAIPRRRWRLLNIKFVMVLALLLNIGVGLHIIFHFPDVAISHDDSYSTIGRFWSREGVFSIGARDASGRLLPTAWRTPVYAGMYALLDKAGASPAAADEVMRFLFLFLNVAVIYLVYRMGRLFNEDVGVAAALLAVLDFSAIYWTHDFNFPDIPVTFLMACFFLACLKILKGEGDYRHAAGASLCLGVTALVKPVVYLMWFPVGALLAAYWLLHPKAGSPARRAGLLAVFLAIQGALLGGWKVRNLWSLGYWDFTTMSGQHQLLWNCGYLEAHQTGKSFAEMRPLVQSRFLTPEARRWDEGMLNIYYGEIAKAYISRAPVEYIGVVLRRVPVFLLGTPPMDFILGSGRRADLLALRKNLFGERHAPFTLFYQALWSGGFKAVVLFGTFMKGHLLLVYALAALGCLLSLRSGFGRWSAVFFCGSVAYFIAASCPVAMGRYRLPVMPAVYVLAGAAAARLISQRTKADPSA